MLTNRERIQSLAEKRHLPQEDWRTLFATWTEEDRRFAANLACAEAVRQFQRKIFLRGLLEISNICKNDCYYCGIRRSNRQCHRYRLTDDEIVEAADSACKQGYRTVVMQGGEDTAFTTERLCGIIRRMKQAHPTCAITLSLGEREDYQELFDAGADRYLLRHETATPAHYAMLHPQELSWQHRVDCLRELRRIGYEVGCGFMVGSPFQTVEHLAAEMAFLEEMRPDMVGLGPFIPHAQTPFADKPAGSAELTLLCLSLVRLLLPTVNLPATTALATMLPDGYQQGIFAGANVVMPNASPAIAVENYKLYDNVHVERIPQNVLQSPLANTLASIGYSISMEK